MKPDLAPGQASRNPWRQALAATLLIQTTAAFLTRLVPLIAPALAAELRWPDAAVGYLAAMTTVGSLAFLMTGSPLIWHTGPVRALQIGLGFGIIGIGLLAVPLYAAPVLACFLIGFGYGPSVPAGSDILQHYSPANHRNLIFSIKQAGVPMGGVLASFTLPPIADLIGWRATLPVAVAIIILTVALVQPLSHRIDADRRRAVPLALRTFLSLQNVSRPLAALSSAPGLVRLAFVGACLAFAQGCWFAFLVTYLVAELHYSLTTAGMVFGLMQATGIAGRVLLGWATDRIGSGLLSLKLIAVSSAATSLMAALTTTGWPLWSVVLLACLAGITVASWNGIPIAEVARLSPAGLVGETAAGLSIVLFVSLITGPVMFAALVGATGRFDMSFLAIAVVSFLPLLALMRRR